MVVGAGFAGLAAVKRLKKAPVRTILIDRHNFNTFSPLLYQVGTALLDPSEICHPVRSVIRRVRNSEFLLADVTGFDLDNRVVITDQGLVAYDYLIVAAGSQTNFFGNASIEARSVGMKNLPDAMALRNEVIRRFEAARWTDDHEERLKLLTFIVVGGGSTGVETAGALEELIRHALRKDFKEMDISDVKVRLLEAADRLLPPFAPRLQEMAKRRLEKIGVEVRLNTAVDKVDEDRVHLADGTWLPAGLVIWAAGVRGTELVGALTDEPARQYTVPVEPTLNLPGRPEVFVIGDMAGFVENGQQLPMLAPVASQEGKLVARNIRAILEGKPPRPFKYLDKGTMSTIGRNSAVVQFKGLKFGGFFGWISWLFVHLVLIVSFRNQLGIISTWFYNYIRNDRPARLILEGDDIEEAEPHA